MERTIGTLWSRALRLRCPRCGEGPLFAGWFQMHERCSACRLKFERSPGYFLGSTYFNYGQTALMTTAVYVILVFGWGIPKQWVAPPLAVYCVLWPLFWFRYARAFWLAFDCFFDATDFSSYEDDSDAASKTNETP